MDKAEVIKILHNERTCVKTADACDRDCGKCPLVMDSAKIIEAYDAAIEMLSQPERQKGEWIPVEDDIPYGLLVECSKCGHRIIINDALEHNYCSECGADMRGEQDETN